MSVSEKIRLVERFSCQLNKPKSMTWQCTVHNCHTRYLLNGKRLDSLNFIKIVVSNRSTNSKGPKLGSRRLVIDTQELPLKCRDSTSKVRHFNSIIILEGGLYVCVFVCVCCRLTILVVYSVMYILCHGVGVIRVLLPPEVTKNKKT